MSARKKMRKQQIKNYCRFVAAGILFLVIVAFVSGCGRRMQEGGSFGEKKVLSKSEIQELTDLVVTDIDSEDSFSEEDYGEDIEGVVITDETDSNSHYTYVWGWPDRGEDAEDDIHILVQVSEDDTVLQTFSEEEISLYHGKWAETELVGITDQELVFYASPDFMNETGVWYRIPLSYENGQEKVLYEQKEVICECEEGSWVCFGVEKYLFCADANELFIINKENGERQRAAKDSKEKSYGYGLFDPWISSEGEAYVVLEGYRDHLVDSLYAYRLGTKEIREITGGISSESRITYKDGKVFYTGLVDHQMQNDYNVYIYDMLTGQKKVLASEAEIREILPAKLSEHADFIREISYAKGTLYLEIRYAEQCHVISCDVEQGDLVLLEGLSELVKHREYQISEPIRNGNGRYYNVNDHNIFAYENSEGGVVERTLDGEYVRTIHLPYDLVYVNNEELIYQHEPDPCKGPVLYSVPLLQLDGNDYPDINHRKILLPKVFPDYGDNVRSTVFYADKKYLIYVTNGHRFAVYDRQAQKFVDIAGIPEERQGFVTGNAMNDISGEYAVFEAHWTGDGKTLVYESWSGHEEDPSKVISYDVDTGKKQKLFTKKDLDKIFGQVSKNQEIWIGNDAFLVSDKIYYVATDETENQCWVVSYDLKKGELQYEAQISDFMNTNQDLPLQSYGEAEGKLFIMKAQKDQEGEVKERSERYYYYDLKTGKQAEISKTDAEGLYLSLVNLVV